MYTYKHDPIHAGAGGAGRWRRSSRPTGPAPCSSSPAVTLNLYPNTSPQASVTL